MAALNFYLSKVCARVLATSVLFLSCVSIPNHYQRSDDSPQFAALQKATTKSCHLDSTRGHFSAILAGPGIPDVELDSLWRTTTTSPAVLELVAEITAPNGETLAAFTLTEASREAQVSVNAPETSQFNQTTDNIIHQLAFIGPQTLRLILCGGHLTQTNAKVFESTQEENVFLVHSSFESGDTTFSTESNLTLSPSSPKRIHGRSTISYGFFQKRELGQLEWAGVITRSGTRPETIKFTTPSADFKLIFSDFE